MDDYVGTLLELAVLALETDSTRAVTVQIPFWEGFKEPALSGNYHDLSHHGQKPEKIKKLLMLEHAILKRDQLVAQHHEETHRRKQLPVRSDDHAPDRLDGQRQLSQFRRPAGSGV